MEIADWTGHDIEVARSSGGVLAVVDPWANVFKTGVKPWPAPELIQKIIKAVRRVRSVVRS
jgi:hypothetical protein